MNDQYYDTADFGGAILHKVSSSTNHNDQVASLCASKAKLGPVQEDLSEDEQSTVVRLDLLQSHRMH
jgi:hypothetical protein